MFEINNIRFGLIKHPVRIDRMTQQKDLGPLRQPIGSPVGVITGSSYDMYQPISAKNYCQEAIYTDGKKDVSVQKGSGERNYVFLDDDHIAIKAKLEQDVQLKALKRKAARLSRQLQAARQARDAYSRNLVQQYLEANRDKVMEVPYKYDYKIDWDAVTRRMRAEEKQQQAGTSVAPATPVTAQLSAKSWLPKWLQKKWWG